MVGFISNIRRKWFNIVTIIFYKTKINILYRMHSAITCCKQILMSPLIQHGNKSKRKIENNKIYIIIQKNIY